MKTFLYIIAGIGLASFVIMSLNYLAHDDTPYTTIHDAPPPPNLMYLFWSALLMGLGSLIGLVNQFITRWCINEQIKKTNR